MRTPASDVAGTGPPQAAPGFGLAALAAATPWLALSGGRWFEYFFNRVPFRSVIPDVGRYPCFTQFAPADVRPDGDDVPRSPR